MYRFRPIEALLDKYNELENQEIYFASPDELNDPMEGYKDVIWRGDLIVWENFVRNYIESVEHFFVFTILLGEEIKIDEKHILVATDPTRFRAFENKLLIREIRTAVYQNDFVKNLPKALAKRKVEIRRLELLFYLELIHPIVLKAVSDSYYKNGFTRIAFLNQDVERFSLVEDNTSFLLELISKIEQADLDHENLLSKFLEETSSIKQQIRLLSKLNLAEDVRDSNNHFLIAEFPEKYLTVLEKSIYPDWYSASFLGHCDNSAVWGHYGNNHKGVCLKFKVSEGQDKKEINLYTNYGYADGPIKRTIPHTLRKINYSRKSVEIDFFRSIGRLPKIAINALWYLDDNGNVSDCASHFIESNEEEWRNTYWENYFNCLSTKLSEWEYENEYRLIVNGDFVDYYDKSMRKLRYDFSDLEAIIFGIKTETSDKLKILKIIEKKCRETKRAHFDFYQAHYSQVSGKIELNKLDLIKFERTAAN